METQAQRGSATCPESHGMEAAEPGPRSRRSLSGVCALSPRPHVVTPGVQWGHQGSSGKGTRRGPTASSQTTLPPPGLTLTALKQEPRALGLQGCSPFTTLPQRCQASSPPRGRACLGHSSLLLVTALPLGILWAEGRRVCGFGVYSGHAGDGFSLWVQGGLLNGGW